MLLREAYRRGLDRDAVVRQHLVQKMRFILGEDEAAPTEAELRAYLAANRERYRSPPTVTLDQVFYADPATVPDDLMAQLANGANLGDLGDSLDMLGNRLPQYSLRDLIGLMGPDVARRVFELPAGAWHGPLQSERGVHFVRVESTIRRPCRASTSWWAFCARTGFWTSNGGQSQTSSPNCARTTASWSTRARREPRGMRT